ncbi:hypothetical protein LTR64_006705 [Lithohypha guttulata]|uniref:Uncharacterized protein n=1 Tax=Lithohypha guttulata TaxID=1690604 RepID=A0AAN7T6Q6_9EURO|nr:hypothetical protein LTR51_004735 [Lithohypha guttulata]KAK5091343.1 hypothetical protein LTR05_001526 [Lithohypha guttulata]
MTGNSRQTNKLRGKSNTTLFKREPLSPRNVQHINLEDRSLTQYWSPRSILPRQCQGQNPAATQRDAHITQFDEDGQGSTSEQQAFEVARCSLEQFSDRLDPFAQLPVMLNRFQEHLLSFYLQAYPLLIYGMSPRLKPHPVATNFSIAINNPPNFQAALARSALYRISLKKYSNDTEKQELEIAVMRHKGEAIRLVKHMSIAIERKTQGIDMLIAAIVSLGTLDTRTGAKDTASVHFMAVRQLLRSIGGPLSIKSVLLSRVMLHFETLYSSTTTSYVWDKTDTKSLLKKTNVFLDDIWKFWLQLAGSTNVRNSNRPSSSQYSGATTTQRMSSPLAKAFILHSYPGLHEALSRPLKSEEEDLTPQDRMKLTFQLTCLLTLCHVVLDHQNRPESLKSWMSNISHMVDDAQLTRQPCNNHLWLIQIHDQSSQHNTRVWQCASFVWLLRHFPYSVQKGLRNWLLAFMEGRLVKSSKNVDSFYFSYAMPH